MVGVDESPASQHALSWAARYALDNHAEVLAVHVLTYSAEFVRDLPPTGLTSWRETLQRRDAAVISLAYLSGTRRAELAALHMADVELDPPALRVVGKGGKQRLVPLSPTAAPFLSAWIEVRGAAPGPLFCAIDRAGNLRAGRPLTGEAIRQLLQRRAAVAGLASVTPHDLRRSYAGDLLDAGADLPAVQQLLGHASPATTSRYDRRGDRARRTAAERLHLDLPTISDADGSEQT